MGIFTTAYADSPLWQTIEHSELQARADITSESNQNLNNLLLKISGSNGNLINEFMQSISDNKLTLQELQNIKNAEFVFMQYDQFMNPIEVYTSIDFETVSNANLLTLENENIYGNSSEIYVFNHVILDETSEYKILPKYETHLEGVTHINKTARIQTISERNENPFIYDLLSYLYNKHNVYALINTSFNIKGEPIVHTKKDALKSAKKMNLDAVIIDFKLINI